jgi:carbamoyltransferase
MAGGVAHNCSMTGKILYSNLFDDIYIQPASHDAGNALGAAYYVLLNEEPEVSYSRLNDVYLGEDIGDDKQIEQELQLWKEFIEISKPENIVEECSQLLADGNVIGWVQGRSEFGPRALGNRSILADPRPSENKNIINRMIKTREDYRPFAPAILEESAREYFEIPEQYGANMFSFMNMVLKVRREKQKSLGAVTHVDGSARVQTVSSTTNRLFYNLIASFEKKTGVPVLLNTSFNNNYEPIVDSINDSVVCFLTTQLNYLCIGNFLIRKRPLKSEAVMKLIPVLPQYVSLNKRKKTSNDGVQMDYVYEISFCYFFGQTVSISKKVYDFLIEVDHSKSVGEIIQNQSLFNIDERIKIEDIVDLWTRRLLKLTVKK